MIELETLRFDDARPYSQIDVGTGDLQTNLFRGLFGLPRALGGSALAALERVDTRGPGGEEPGALSEVWLRYGWARARGGLEFDYRRRSQERGDLYAPAVLNRSEWSARARMRLAEGVVLGAHYAKTGFEGVGSIGDTVQGEDVSELAGGLWVDRGPFWARTRVQAFSGAGVPNGVQEGSLGLDHERFGGIAGTIRRESWEERSLSRTSVRGWTAPVMGAFLFAERDAGEAGVPYVPFLEPLQVFADSVYVPYERGLRSDDRTTTRYGMGFGWRGLRLEGARVTVETDSIFPLGFPMDRTAAAFPGSRREGYEASVTVPVPWMDGLSLQGSAVIWDTLALPQVDSGEVAPVPAENQWPYVPRFSYDARLHYRRTFLPTGNFELQVDLGVREREAMHVFVPSDTVSLVEPPEDGEEPPLPPLDVVRFHQNWYARLEMRIVSLKIFIEWENVSVRRDRADFPGRVLPATRALYGVRWTLLN